MHTHTIKNPPTPIASGWLKRYYFTRFAFSAAWVVLAFSVAASVPLLAAIMLIGLLSELINGRTPSSLHPQFGGKFGGIIRHFWCWIGLYLGIILGVLP